MQIEIPGYIVEIEYTPGDPGSGLREGFNVVAVSREDGTEMSLTEIINLYDLWEKQIWAAIDKKKREAEEEHFQSLEGLPRRGIL